MPQRFGEKLKWLRGKRGLSLRALADELEGVSYSYISLVENGERQPNAELIFKVSKLFGVSADDLLDDGREVEVGE
jgi:transcriptional regulator with XRE-family HTH domain